MHPLVCSFLATGFVLLSLAPAHADVMTLSVTSDTFIMDGANADNNSGANGSVHGGTSGSGSTRRGLYQFNLSAIPAGAVVTSAVFDLTVVGVPGGTTCPTGVDSTFELFALTAGWAEGAQVGSNGSGAAPGETTWNSRFHGTTAWTNAGGDFNATVLAGTFVSAAQAYSWSGANLLAAVQSWTLNPAVNHGLLMKSDSEGTGCTARQFGSREGLSPATLTVGYATPPPPSPAVFTSVAVPTNLNLVLAWSNDPAAKYDVLYTRDLAGTQVWRIAEANIPAATNAPTKVWTDPPYLAGPLFPSNRALWYAARSLPASPSGMPVRLQVIVSNLVSPVVMTFPPDGSDRLFVCEQTGKVLVVDSARTLLPAPFLHLGTNVQVLSGSYDERGLLGLAFHPGYATNRKFYVYYSSPKTGAGINHESRLSEFLCSATNANLADPASERILLRFDEPESNHNGGNLEFGPDGYLYVSTGDGGGAGDVHGAFGNAQVLTNLLGKMLRIDVNTSTNYAIPSDNPFATNGPPVRPEIFAYGFRNPWKASFDGTNCWVADVGQNTWEEVNWLRKGRNYGWRILEGTHAFNLPTAEGLGVDIPALEFPVHEYKHGPLGISVIGGAVYRGTNYPALQGRYVFGDFSTSFSIPNGFLYYLEETRSNLWERFSFWLAPTGGTMKRFVKSFGTDQAGEIYLLSTTNLGPTGTSGDLRQLLPP